ncbi:MAG: hypothetical protein ABFE01_24135 [Phycisphaerales bacterium]
MASTPYATSVIQGSAPNVVPITIPIYAMSAIVAGDELTDWVPGFNFEIVGLDFVCVTPITTAAKAATITPYIDAVAVPGCAVTVSGTKAKGVVTAGSTPTSRVFGNAASKIKLTGSAVTTFSEGAGYLLLKIRNIGNIA